MIPTSAIMPKSAATHVPTMPAMSNAAMSQYCGEILNAIQSMGVKIAEKDESLHVIRAAWWEQLQLFAK